MKEVERSCTHTPSLLPVIAALPSMVRTRPLPSRSTTRPMWSIAPMLRPPFQSKNTVAPGRGSVPNRPCFCHHSAHAMVPANFPSRS